MQLSAEHFEDILAALFAASPVPRNGEKRAFFRMGARYGVTIRFGQQQVNGWLRDVSVAGLGVCAPAAPAVGEAFLLELPREDGSKIEIRCTARNCARISPELFQIGATYERPAVSVPEPVKKPARKSA